MLFFAAGLSTSVIVCPDSTVDRVRFVGGSTNVDASDSELFRFDPIGVDARSTDIPSLFFCVRLRDCRRVTFTIG